MTRRNKIIYWIATLWLALGMVSTGAVQLFKAKEGQGGLDSIIHLGYPVYILTILGIWKALGVVALFLPGKQAWLNLVREWAYAGFFFVTTGAAFSHIASGDSMDKLLPALLLLVLTLISWYFRPADKKLQSSQSINP